MRGFYVVLSAVVCLWVGWGGGLAVAQEPEPSVAEPEDVKTFDIGFEAKAHYRDSDPFAFPVPFPFSPDMLPPGAEQGFLGTVDPGESLEVSTLTLFVDGRWGDWVTAHAKVDFIDLYGRNPTSSAEELDVDEVWVRFGRETEPAFLPERSGVYVKIGKFPKLERQDDRHLESYGLVSTAFNRFEDLGVELGADLGRYVYLKVQATQGNPVFLRDPNALAGDNGLPEQLEANPDPELGTGTTIPYDANVTDLDADGELELGAGLGFRLADASGRRGFELLGFHYERELAETVDIEGSFYGGDLDLLRGPLNAFPFPITSDDKTETGANVWLYLGGFSLFGQYVDQDLAGLDRTGAELELAWSFDLPLRFAVAGRQLFPWIQPAVRFSRLEPDFAAPAITPAPSFAWEWEKLDVGLRLGILPDVDLTVEYADNTMTLASGAEVSQDELLTTLRWRVR